MTRTRAALAHALFHRAHEQLLRNPAADLPLQPARIAAEAGERPETPVPANSQAATLYAAKRSADSASALR